MIDIQSEQVESLTQAAKWSIWPTRRKGKRPAVQTLYRWAQNGCRGVKLETLRVGGTLCTSKEAVARFVERLTADDQGQPAPTRTIRQRERDIARAERECEELGV